MSQTIKLPNYKSLNIRERGVLSADHVVGATTLNLENSDGFVIGYPVMIGKPVEERTEITTSGGINTNKSALCSALKYDHLKNTEVFVLFGMELCIYRAQNVDGKPPALESFTKIDTIDIDADNALTYYTDNAVVDGANYWWRFTYKGPTGETDLAASPAVRGGNVGVYCTLDAVRNDAGLDNALYVTDDLIAPHRDAAQAFINGRLQGRYVVPFADPVNPWISDICKRLAAGYLMKVQWPSTPERGQTKVDAAVKDLEDIASGEMVLTDAVGAPTSAIDGGSGSYWPNADTANTPTEQGGGERKFRVGMRY